MGNIDVSTVSGRASPPLSSVGGDTSNSANGGSRSRDSNSHIRCMADEIRRTVERIGATLDRIDQLIGEAGRSAGPPARHVQIRYGGGRSVLAPDAAIAQAAVARFGTAQSGSAASTRASDASLLLNQKHVA
jgi:hypothetical protein